MKKCRACQERINSKAKLCPHCGADQRNILFRHPKKVFFLFGLLIAYSKMSGGEGEAPAEPPAEEEEGGGFLDDLLAPPEEMMAEERVEEPAEEIPAEEEPVEEEPEEEELPAEDSPLEEEAPAPEVLP
jgi:DNA-directed RNA polymerase beta' subunit